MRQFGHDLIRSQRCSDKLTTRHVEMLREQQFEAKQRKNALNTERASVNEVTIEQLCSESQGKKCRIALTVKTCMFVLTVKSNNC